MWSVHVHHLHGVLCRVGPKGCHSRRLVAPVRPRSGPTIACPRHDVSAMPGRVRAALSELKPTARQHEVQSAVGKRRLAELSPSAGHHLVTHAKQNAVMSIFGLGGAAASAFIRTAQAAWAAVQDTGSTRAAVRIIRAFAADSAAQALGRASQPLPGLIGETNSEGSRQEMVEAIDEALSKRRRYSRTTCGAMDQVVRSIQLRAGGARASLEVLGSSNPFFKATGPQLRDAAVEYVQIHNGEVCDFFTAAFSEFVGPTKLFDRCSATSHEMTTAQVTEELMKCTNNVGLRVPSFLASMKQFIVELRQESEVLSSYSQTYSCAAAVVSCLYSEPKLFPSGAKHRLTA